MRRQRENLLTASDLAGLCEVDLKTIHNWVDRGRIPHFRTPGRHLRFRAADVADFLKTWGYSVPRELARLGSATVLVVGNAPSLASGEGRVVRRADDGYEALILAGVEPPVAVVVERERLQGIDLGAMLGALHRAQPGALLVVVGEGTDVPAFAVRVSPGDEAGLEAALAPLVAKRAAASTPAPAESGVGVDQPRKAAGA